MVVASSRTVSSSTARSEALAASFESPARRGGVLRTAGPVPPLAANRRDDLVGECGETAQECLALLLEALDDALVLVGAALRLVQLARAEHALVVAIDAGDVRGDLVAEVRVVPPLDRALGDALDD